MSIFTIDTYKFPVANVYARLLLVGGGGGGSSGGGGGGGVLDVIAPIYSTYNYTVTIGNGGANGSTVNQGTTSEVSQPGTDGGNTVFSGNSTNIIAFGGGGGGGWAYNYTGSNTIYQGRDGGCGGGAAATTDGTLTNRGPFRGGSFAFYYLYQGAQGGSSVNLSGIGSGGGGASNSGYSSNGFSASINSFTSNFGGGGDGKISNITGSSLYYGGGGAGASSSGAPQASGGGGGGQGSLGVLNGVDGRGGGGAGFFTRNAGTGSAGKGGKGIFYISYPGIPRWVGGDTITAVGSNTLHTFTSNGTLVPTEFVNARYLIVGGGGAGGQTGGGGGGGGVLNGNTFLATSLTYTITVGLGGANTSGGQNGGNSSITGTSLNLLAQGGGAGGNRNDINASNGGSGGGAGSFDSQYAPNLSIYNATRGGTGNTTGIMVQGYSGGFVGGFPLSTWNASYGITAGAGGGGAGSSGTNNSTSPYQNPTAGGPGRSDNITGILTFYAGGGGGAGSPNTVIASGSTAQHGGGTGSYRSGTSTYVQAAAGTDGLGGGGGGGLGNLAGSRAGGSGIVVISYPGSQLWSGGSISTVGANTVHTFTANGNLIPL